MYIAFWADFHYYCGIRLLFGMTEKFGHDQYHSVIASVDLCFIFEK